MYSIVYHAKIATKPTNRRPLTLTHLNTPTKPWSRIAIDIAGPFHVAPQHQRFVTTAIDCFSKFPEILLSNDVTSGKIISWLCDIFARFGKQSRRCDNGQWPAIHLSRIRRVPVGTRH